ncbi:MAG: type IV secretory system conjugative DNA transfer family protein [Clostridia bacterium]|nr:type IV secretory system conjugative DNA transfer family protein [Clostridia bacterium]
MNYEIVFIIVVFFLLFVIGQQKSNRKYIANLEKQKKRAMSPLVDKSLLHSKPEKGQLMLGKTKAGKYVTNSVLDDGHRLILGGSGSGKSANYIIDDLLMNDSDDCSLIAVDIKGELSYKSKRLDDPHIKIFDPQDSASYGFNPFWKLADDSSEQEIYETMQVVSESLIKIDQNGEAYWSLSARSMLTSLLIYHYQNGIHNLPDIVSAIMSMPIKQEIEKIINTLDEGTLARKLMVPYYDLAEDTLTSIFSSINLAVNTFFDKNLVYALRDAPRKITPKDIENGFSIFLRVKEEKLTAYSLVLSLIINMFLIELSARPEGSKKVLFIIDELPRLITAGSIGMLPIASLTIRSKGVSLVLVTQSLSALEGGFKKSEISTLIANCSTKIILQCSSQETAKEIVGMIPKYTQVRSSKTTGKNKSGTTSFEEKARVEESDLMNLVRDGKAIILHNTGYYCLNKVPYYKDKYLKPKADAIRQYNDEYLKNRGEK